MEIEMKIKDFYFKWLLGLSALSILAVSAYFSINGISQLFSGQRTTVMILAGSLEFAKIIVTTYLTRHWFDINKIMRTYFLVATIVLILISSAGIFANLTDAYSITVLKTQVVNIESNSLDFEEKSLTERKKDLQYEVITIGTEIELIRKSIQRNDNQVQKLYHQMEIDSTVNWISSIWEFKNQNKNYKSEITNLRNNKDKLREKIIEINKKLKNVWINSAKMKTSNKMSEIGPLKKLSELFKIDMDTVAKNFIFIIIIVFDPLGVLLVVAFNLLIIKKNKIKEKNIKQIKKIIKSDSINSKKSIDLKKTVNSKKPIYPIKPPNLKKPVKRNHRIDVR